jgi:hypothetical protein
MATTPSFANEMNFARAACEFIESGCKCVLLAEISAEIDRAYAVILCLQRFDDVKPLENLEEKILRHYPNKWVTPTGRLQLPYAHSGGATIVGNAYLQLLNFE